MVDKISEVFLEMVGDEKAMIIFSLTVLGTFSIWNFGLEAKSLIGMIISGLFGMAVGDKRGNNKNH